MWLAKKHFSCFSIVVGVEGDDAEEEIEVRYRLRGKSLEFAFPPDEYFSRRKLRELKQWWEEEARSSTLLPVQKQAPGVCSLQSPTSAPGRPARISILTSSSRAARRPRPSHRKSGQGEKCACSDVEGKPSAEKQKSSKAVSTCQTAKPIFS